MLIHAGAGRLIRGGDVIGMFDMDGHFGSDVNREFLKLAGKRGVIESAGEDLPRAFIVTSGVRGGGERVVLSHLSPGTLAKRGSGV